MRNIIKWNLAKVYFSGPPYTLHSLSEAPKEAFDEAYTAKVVSQGSSGVETSL